MNAELIGRWEAGDEEMPFTFKYGQHWEVECGSKVFDRIVIEPDNEIGGKGSGIVSFKRLKLCFLLRSFEIGRASCRERV